MSLLALVAFLVSREARAATPALPLRVRETAGVARTAEITRTGISLPRSANVLTTAPLAIVDAAGAPVPAQFRVLARWNSGRNDDAAPIQWLLVTLPASVAANATATYRLITDGSAANPPPTTRLTLTDTTVDTGAASFTLGSGTSLFDNASANGATLISGGVLTARVNDRDTAWAARRRFIVEESGPLSATIIVDGTYDFPPTGGGGLSSHRRYTFSVGSPTAIVQQTLAWEGDLCRSQGAIVCNGAPNALHVRQVRDTLGSRLTGVRPATAIGARGAAAVSGATSIRQRLRPSRTAPPRFEIGSESGAKADGALLAVSGAEGTLAIALDHMHRYEPQALRVLDNGDLAIDIADDQAWLGARQGLFATLAVGALPRNVSRADLEASVWAPLNHPLRAWPDAAWWAASDAVGEIPVGSLPAPFADYDRAVRDPLVRTIAETEAIGVYGLMTYGLFPRLWGNPIYSDEVDCGGNDPTPQESWDDLYCCTTWTDYHNTASTASIWAMRSGETEWLDDIARPAALRMLFTQIFQCSPSDNYFYCGQAPAGYGGYRSDFNSSHAYFDNLQLHYWLTGDSTVVETLKRGSTSMRDYLCERRPASPCQPNDAPTDEYANLTGRVASQWFSTLRGTPRKRRPVGGQDSRHSPHLNVEEA